MDCNDSANKIPDPQLKASTQVRQPYTVPEVLADQIKHCFVNHNKHVQIMKISLKSEGEVYARRGIFVQESSVRNLIGFLTELSLAQPIKIVQSLILNFMTRTVSHPFVNNPWSFRSPYSLFIVQV